MAVETIRHAVRTSDGWSLSLKQTFRPDRLKRSSMPVVIVPGYGMNSFIFGFHPRGRSFEAALVDGGLEVFSADLRAQGDSRPHERVRHDWGLWDLAATDLGTVFDAVLAHTRTDHRGQAGRVCVIGASLGATIMFAHAALNPDHRVGAMVSIGGPVRWVKVHPLLRVAFASPRLVGAIPLRGTRTLAKTALPVLLARAPWLLSIYINREHVDESSLAELVKTVEDPNRHVNREIATWIREKDLVLRGVNITHALPSIQTPLLCAIANGDGIVPAETARFVLDHIGASDKRVLEVGTEATRLAHADMFISDHADAMVFGPIRDWILER